MEVNIEALKGVLVVLESVEVAIDGFRCHLHSVQGRGMG